MTINFPEDEHHNFTAIKTSNLITSLVTAMAEWNFAMESQYWSEVLIITTDNVV